MEFTATARFQRVSPQKARLVLDLIKGQRISDAFSTLAFTKKRIAGPVEKLLRSAVDELARNAGGEFGYSNTILLMLDSPPGGGAYMFGLQPFQLQIIPEPSVQTLAIVCAGIFALWRGMWRKRTGSPDARRRLL